MAFRDFTFPEVQHTLGLTLAEADGVNLTLDRREYFVAELGRIMGVLAHIIRDVAV